MAYVDGQTHVSGSMRTYYIDVFLSFTTTKYVVVRIVQLINSVRTYVVLFRVGSTRNESTYNTPMKTILVHIRAVRVTLHLQLPKMK